MAFGGGICVLWTLFLVTDRSVADCIIVYTALVSAIFDELVYMFVRGLSCVGSSEFSTFLSLM